MPAKTFHVETVAQAYLELLRERGVDCFLANAGTDFASIIDAFARFAAEGKATPRPILVPHEFVAVSMAHGYYAVTGRPQAVMVHVTVGSANAVGAIINASRTRTPVLFTAGRTPVTEDGGLRGSRDTHIHWAQEAFDQAGMLREYVKWDYELRHPSQLEAVVDRALETALTEPRGPVYLTLPREVLAQPLDKITVASPPRRGGASRTFPDPLRIEDAARALARARAPLIVTASAGRAPGAVAALVEVAEAGGIGVIEAAPECQSFPSTHPSHLGYGTSVATHPAVVEADVLLVVDCDVPWIPATGRPRDDACVIHLGVDPFFARYPMRSFPSDLAIAADPEAALPLLAAALRRHVDPEALAARRDRLEEAHGAARRAWAAAAQAERDRVPIGFEWAARCLGEVYGPDTILFNEYPLDLRHAPPPGPGSYFGAPHSGGLGWGLGAALGAKLAHPEKTVIAAIGDGAYFFAVPTACHFAARTHDLPILTVIFNNGSWDAVKRAAVRVHPEGWGSAGTRFPLADLAPSPRYEEIVRAFDGHGERVERPEELPGALQRGLAVVRDERRQALLNVVCRR